MYKNDGRMHQTRHLIEDDTNKTRLVSRRSLREKRKRAWADKNNFEEFNGSWKLTSREYYNDDKDRAYYAFILCLALGDCDFFTTGHLNSSYAIALHFNDRYVYRKVFKIAKGYNLAIHSPPKGLLLWHEQKAYMVILAPNNCEIVWPVENEDGDLL